MHLEVGKLFQKYLLHADYLLGPSVGDIRSRCMFLSSSNIKQRQHWTKESISNANSHTRSNIAISKLLDYRLCSNSEDEAIRDWRMILDQSHTLWQDVSTDLSCILISFFNYFENALADRISEGKQFSFKGGSLGNFFLTGARLFFNSLESAVYLLSRIIGVNSKCLVIPCVENNITLDVGVYLEDGCFIKGQNNISHPNWKGGALDKNNNEPLPSKIKMVVYVGFDGSLRLNQKAEAMLTECNTIVYGMGSLYTSIIPILILERCGETIARSSATKILILNGTNDRETGDMSLMDYIEAITLALNRYGDLKNNASKYITDVFYCKGTNIKLCNKEIQNLGIRLIEIQARDDLPYHYHEEDLVTKLVLSRG